jgi:hypothetical protein
MFWRSSRCARLAVLQMALAAATPAAAQSSLSGDPIRMSRAAGRITIDGDLNDEGWRGATRIDRWYETNPGDNTEPKVRNVGYLTYDDRFFYAGFEFDDPAPDGIRAPYADRALYTFDTSAKSGTFSGQLLLAYKVNWQSVMFIGYGDDRELSDLDRLEQLDRQFFVKLSYAIQR